MPQRKGAAARDAGTFDDMYSGAVAGAGRESAWTRPRPVVVEDAGGQDISGELAPVVERDYERPSVEKIFDALDYVMPTLKPNDQAVYGLMVRRSHGRGRKTCLVNLPLFSERTNLSVSGVQYALARLAARKLVVRGEEIHGKNQDQGVEYEVKVPVRK